MNDDGETMPVDAVVAIGVALNILRETVMGRELFDYAFKEYARRWAFKQPYPADFFRTMEDASGVDLDWFWRGWFYGTGVLDQAVTSVLQPDGLEGSSGAGKAKGKTTGLAHITFTQRGEVEKSTARFEQPVIAAANGWWPMPASGSASNSVSEGPRPPRSPRLTMSLCRSGSRTTRNASSTAASVS